jgi:hypothetical protein
MSSAVRLQIILRTQLNWSTKIVKSIAETAYERASFLISCTGKDSNHQHRPIANLQAPHL